jgi:Cytochrome P460
LAQWTAAGPAGGAVRADAPNGIGFHDLADFASWKAMSTTERFDNGTMRLILANAIAEQAIRDGQMHPWPKGAMFAKVAWDQLPDSAGEIHIGAFKQVEFMIRDQDLPDGWVAWHSSLMGKIPALSKNVQIVIRPWRRMTMFLLFRWRIRLRYTIRLHCFRIVFRVIRWRAGLSPHLSTIGTKRCPPCMGMILG